MNRLLAIVFGTAIAWGGPAWAAELPNTPDPGPATQVLTREQAVSQALKAAPSAEAAAARLRAASGDLAQAGALPNPALGIELENFGGSSANGAMEESELTLSLSQTVELGGKRRARTDVAAVSRKAASYGYAAARLDLVREVRMAFTEAVAAEAGLRLAEDRGVLAREVVRSVRGRVEAGREPVLQQRRAEISLQQAEIELKNASRRLAMARNQLGILTGLDLASFQLDSSWFGKLEGTPVVTTERPAEPVDLLQQEAGVERSRAELMLENSRSIPDLTVSAGVRRFQETDDTAFVAGISIPIPVFDQNRGAITKARESVSAAEAELRATRLARAKILAKAEARLAETRDNALALKQSIVPTAEEAFRFAREGYNQGKFSYLEVLEAQRALFDARRSQIDALQGFHETQADLDRLNATVAASEEK